MASIVTVEFHADTLFAVEREEGVFVAVTPICKALGISPDMQRKRIQGDIVLGEGAIVTIFPSAGGMQETLCLRLDLINGWLFTIDDRRVRDAAVREKVLAYKRECHRVLYEHFHGRRERRAERERAAVDRRLVEALLHGHQLRVLAAVRQAADPDGQAAVSIGSLAAMSGLSAETVRRAVALVIALGLVEGDLEEVLPGLRHLILRDVPGPG